jgi:N-acetylglucosaminyldiphosphoundecaprenol N-acetyl-beta-D-mannosaminyltransferase
MLKQKTSFQLPVRNILGFAIAALPFDKQLRLILDWAQSGSSKLVCIANTHMLVEAQRNERLARVLKYADLITPDGMPLVWMLKFMGFSQQNRVAGPDLLPELCGRAEDLSISVFFLGSHPDVLERMRLRLKREFPELRVAGLETLPYRPLSEREDAEVVDMLNRSGARVLFLSLGCPKQEIWMAAHKERLKMVMIGVGAAFPIYAGVQQRAPFWMQMSGLEWFYRLIQEPRRLWGRYARTIPVFVLLAFRQLLWNDRRT